MGEFSHIVHEIYATVRQDELLVTHLGVSYKMTYTECGSILAADGKKKVMTIKMSREIDPSRVHNIHVKLGEGIAGLIAKVNLKFR